MESKISMRGGKRPGAGRKRAIQAAPVPEAGLSAEAYLAKVVSGELPADPSRVRAAATLIRYESTQQRAPLASPKPKELAKRAEVAAEKSIATAFEKKAAEIRRKHASRQLKD
jgi:hypothetical protein